MQQQNNIQYLLCLLSRLTLALIITCHCFPPVHAFATDGKVHHGRQRGRAANTCATSPIHKKSLGIYQLASVADSDNNIDKDDDDITDENDKEFHQQLQSRHYHLQVEKTRTALEEQHTRSFLKRRPVKLPYNDARKWVQANLGASTKEEYDDLVANGNLRTPYIPKRPEEYYTSTREWISWEHFLTGVFDDEQPSEMQPCTGVFD